MSRNRILVTGATGNIGRALIAQLAAAGADVLAGSPGGEAVAGVPGRAVDFTQPEQLVRAFDGIDTLFLLLPLVPAKPQLAANALAVARRTGVGHVLRSSGAGADAASPVPLARLQGSIDQLVIESGIPYTLVRPNSFMQNWVNFYGGMVKGGTVYLSTGDGATSWIDVADIAAVDAQILMQPSAHRGQAYTVTGGEALNARDALERIGRVLGRSIAFVPIDEASAVKGMREAGMDAWTVEMLSSLNVVTAAGYTAGVSPVVQQITGRAPRSFEAFADAHAGAWR